MKEYDDHIDIEGTLPPIRLATWNLDWGFDFIHDFSSLEWPTIEQRLSAWAEWAKYLPLAERKLRISEKYAVLEGLYDDPEQLIGEALRNA